MLTLNLRIKNEQDKNRISVILYQSDMDRLKELSNITGTTQQNLCRHAFNNMFDETKDITG